MRLFLIFLQLRRVFLLIDSRQGIKKVDTDMMEMLDIAAVNYQIILTKIDKISNKELELRKKEILALYDSHPAMHPLQISTSSENGNGLEEIRGEIFDLIK